MTRKQGLLTGAIIAIAFVGTAAPAVAEGEGQKAQIPVIADDQVCLQKIRSEERAHRIPGGLLAAIGFTESGRTVTGQRTVWPWTVNAEGEGHFFDSKDAAVKFVEGKLADGVESIDVGCMQINLQQHPDAFTSLDDAFDPGVNVAYGADFLKALHGQTNGWLAAARRYHSATPEKGEPYGELVLANWTGAAKQKEVAADTVVATAAEPKPEAVQLASAAGFLRAQPVRAEPVRVEPLNAAPVSASSAAGNLSLFSQFYAPQPTAPQPQQTSSKSASQAPGQPNGSLLASTQRIFQRRVVPGQTGLTLEDYRAN
jgi:hypothetical protein